tara:strand:+ start:137718 stop:138302 length:585 start_codon:yes stop_codon:yes gene_type:complete
MNLNKIIYIIITLTLILLPCTLYFSYNYTSQETYEKNYYFLKEDDLDYLKKANLQDEQIINERSIKLFIKEAITEVYNYRPATALEVFSKNNNKVEYFFNADYFPYFYDYFVARINAQSEARIIFNEVILSKEPIFIGSFKSDGTRVYLLEGNQILTGENGQTFYSKLMFEIFIGQEDYSKNKKGLSIKKLSIK